jgi:hypothetical protein
MEDAEGVAALSQRPPDGPLLRLGSGDELPQLRVQAFDAWGNATGPSSGLEAWLVVECASLSPPSAEFRFSAAGVARTAGARDCIGTSPPRSGLPSRCHPMLFERGLRRPYLQPGEPPNCLTRGPSRDAQC